MNTTTDNTIMLHLTGKHTAGDITVDDLKTIADKYPAFGVAKFLLAKKAQQENHADFNAFARQAVLHFNNPYWFHFKLNEDELIKDETSLVKPVASIPQAAVNDIATEEISEAVQGDANVSAELDNRQPVEEKIMAAEMPVEKDDIVPLIPKEELPVEEDEIVPAIAREESRVEDDEIVPAVTDEKILTGQDEIIPAIPREEIIIEDDIVPAITHEELPVEKGEITHGTEPIEVDGEEEVALSVTQDEAVIEDEHPSPVVTEISEPQNDDKQIFAGDEEDLGSNDDPDAENESGIAGAPANDKISAVLQGQLQEFNKPVTAETPIPIETGPYHTVDYFASQGIKLSLELQKQDHLGVKVKKFTDWLKQMKRIGPTPADLGIDEAAEHKVQDIAATSNQTKEVLTEAMAEVWAKQGMNDKAIQVYKKLSFLDPAKSAYFAAKIQHLKGL